MRSKQKRCPMEAKIRERINWFDQHTCLGSPTAHELQNVTSTAVANTIASCQNPFLVDRWTSVVKGHQLGSGNFCQVHSVLDYQVMNCGNKQKREASSSLSSSSSSLSSLPTTSPSTSSPTTTSKQSFSSSLPRIDPSTVVVKTLNPSLQRSSKDSLVGCLDLFMEARLLELLQSQQQHQQQQTSSHQDNDIINNNNNNCDSYSKHLIRLYAVKATNLDKRGDDFNDDDDDAVVVDDEDDNHVMNYFVVLERLSETLSDRMQQWKKQMKQRRPRIVLYNCIKSHKWDHGRCFLSCFRETILQPKNEYSRQQQRWEELIRVQTAAVGIAKGMEYLHSKGIIFRDLKPSNIGFDASGTVKIFDFGLAREVQVVIQSGRSLGFAGTPRYMAKEVLGGAKWYTLSADVYSFGVLLWEICTCRTAFKELTTLEEYREHVGRKGMRPSLLSVRNALLRQLIAECWNDNPKKRPDMNNVRMRLETICGNIPSQVPSSQNVEDVCVSSHANCDMDKALVSESTWRVHDMF